MVFDAEILFNVAWITGVLIIVFFGLRKEWREEKAKERKRQEAARQVDKALTKTQKSYAMQYISLPQNAKFPTFEADGFELADLAWQAIELPPATPLPTLGSKRQITEGAIVRLAVIFERDSAATDVWARIATDRLGDVFSGDVFETANPSCESLRGKRLCFHANHIAEIVSSGREVLQ
ncbi:MAG: hypothetical protein H6876_04555 [Hyphomicrobiaceae bacterium]|nr:hypothetical protein [Hyphomicrobiaceae bacterium]MCC0007378.1 hypothetical protein [Hyphomicrobiaceae bacterium]